MFVRPAHPGDETAIMELIHELADFEKAPAEVINTPQQLAKDLFEDSICKCIVAELDQKVVGFALYYYSYSTWKGKCLYLEDFYVKPAYRGRGYGDTLFNEIVSIARSEGVRRMDWQVLAWNEGAIRFYEHKRAILDPEWINGRLFFED